MQISSTEKSVVYQYGENEVIKEMKLNSTTAREISFNKLLKDCPVVLHPRKEVVDNGKISLFFPLTKELQEFNLELFFRRMILILATLEKSKIAHLDFRPENLCHYENEILVRDFDNAYFLTSYKGYLPKERFPMIQIGGPEFYYHYNTFPRNQLLSGEFSNRYPSQILESLSGAEFDERADVWSLASWIYRFLEGKWLVNHEGDFSKINISFLPKKYDKVGEYLYEILNSLDYQKRPWASQIAQELSIKIPTFSLSLPHSSLNFEKLTKAELPELWKTEFPGEDITNYYLWILLITQRSNFSNPKNLLFLFLKNEQWSNDEVDIFIDLGKTIFTNNLITSFSMNSIRETYLEFLRNPGEFNSSDLNQQRNYLINFENAIIS